MKRLVLELGLYNASLWLALACAAWVACRRRLPDESWRIWKPVAILMILGAFANIGMGLGKAFVSPRDFLQDIVSGKEYLEGRSMYPDGMSDRFGKMLADEETSRKLNLGWTLGQLSDKSREGTLSQHWVQAHPPFMSVFFGVLYKLYGLIGSQIALALISMACLIWSIVAIVGELRPDWGRWRTTALAAGFCGSGPVVTSFRNGQADLILLAFIVAAWILLRSRRDFPAGVSIGLAVSFKLIPALLLPVLLIRWPRAFLGAATTAAIVLTLILLRTGEGVLADYRRTAEGIILEYASYPSNISLLGFITRSFQFFGRSLEDARTVWQEAGILLAGGLMFLAHYRRSETDDKCDVDFIVATAVCLMPFCSPVAWDHYLTFLIFPLAIAAAKKPTPALAGLALVWAIPETAYLFALELLNAHGGHALAVWFVAPLRTYAMVGLAGGLVVRSFQFPPKSAPG